MASNKQHFRLSENKRPKCLSWSSQAFWYFGQPEKEAKPLQSRESDKKRARERITEKLKKREGAREQYLKCLYPAVFDEGCAGEYINQKNVNNSYASTDHRSKR